MDDLDGLIDGNQFFFRVPLWTVAHLSPSNEMTVAYVPTAFESHGECAFGLFTDSDQAERYRDYSNADWGNFRVFTISDPVALEGWLIIAEEMEITHVAFDYTHDPATGRCSGRIETVAEVRRIAKTMRHVQ